MGIFLDFSFVGEDVPLNLSFIPNGPDHASMCTCFFKGVGVQTGSALSSSGQFTDAYVVRLIY